jgi:GT2 family glycosyltransferase
MSNARIQFVIVNYRTAELTIRCIQSMISVGIPERDIVIVDNHSQDGSVEIISSKIAEAKLVQSDRNGGFAAGVNLGIRFTEANYVLVLNPDTVFISNFTNEVTSILEADHSIGVIGLNLLNPDLSPQYSARRFYSMLDILIRRTRLRAVWPWTLLNDRHLMKSNLASGALFDADWVLGTGFVVRKAMFENLSGMDEGYFMYMEDVDLCARVWQSRSRVVCAPTAAIIHDHQRKSAKSPISRASWIHLTSLRRFSKKFRIPILYVNRREQVLRSISTQTPALASSGDAQSLTVSRLAVNTSIAAGVLGAGQSTQGID